MCDHNNNDSNCLAKTFEIILMLQQKRDECDTIEGCQKPFLGPTISPICPNTRPITLFSCCNNVKWEMPFTLNGNTGTSNVFRIENIDDNCATFRVLAPNPDLGTTTTTPYVATEDFFTIKLNCIGAIKCLGDTLVPGI